MNAPVGVATAMAETRERWANVPRVLSRLKRIYGLSDRHIAGALGLANAQDVQRRRSGRTRVAPEELTGLAQLFDLDEGVFFMEPNEATAIVLERDPNLVKPWELLGLVGLPVGESTPSVGSTIPGYLKRSRRSAVERLARQALEVERAHRSA